MTVKTTVTKYKILQKRCLSSRHLAYIPWVINWGCECWNCKIKIRQYREHKWAFIWDTSFYDYMFDVEEVLQIKDLLIT